MRPNPARSADAVDKILGKLGLPRWSLILPRLAARSDVGSHQRLEVSVRKSTHSLVSLRLRAVTVDHRSIEAITRQ
jgi:hypothetical protein